MHSLRRLQTRSRRTPTVSGFTIIELLVAVSVGALASILIVTAFVYTYGGILAEQTRTRMTLDSQVFLRRMVEDIRVANAVRATNQIADTYGPTGGWVTNDPANILIVTEPATDSSNEFIYDSATGYPYQHEIVYFGSGGTMYRRLLVNSMATGTVQLGTCPSGTAGCPPDIELVDNLENMLFQFFDIDDQPTASADQARSIQITINLRKQVYGNDITTTNTTRVTLRNEN